MNFVHLYFTDINTGVKYYFPSMFAGFQERADGSIHVCLPLGDGEGDSKEISRQDWDRIKTQLFGT